MKKSYQTLVLLAWLSPLSQVSAGVDCDGVPHTKLELEICGDPVLRVLDSELTAAFKEARERGLIDRQMIAGQRNQVARQCRRQADKAFKACLYNTELKSLEWVAGKLGQSPVASTTRLAKNPRYDVGFASRAAYFKRQLAVAESRLSSTNNPELTVITLVSLLAVYNEQHSRRGNVGASIRRLESRLASGCDHAQYGAKWQKQLQENNRSCDKLRSPPQLSSADY